MAHMKPLPTETTPELQADFAIFEKILGFVPNSLLTMQRQPAMVKGFGELTRAMMSPDGGVDLGLMRLVAHFASRAAGCQYCEAHSLVAAKIHDVPQDKLDAIWEYQTRWISRWRPARCPMRLTQNYLPVCASIGKKHRSYRFLAPCVYMVF